MRTGKAAGVAFDRRGAGEPLMLIHGTGGSRAVWAPVVERLASGCDVIAVDLPGHGESDPPPEGVPHDPIGYARLLARLLDELSLETAHAAGSSVGGWTALELAKLGRARSVVALAPAGLWAKRDPWQSVAQLWMQHRMGGLFGRPMARAMRRPRGRKLLLSGVLARPENIPPEAAIEMARTYSSTPTFDSHLAATRRARFSGGRGIDVPVTVAWGDKERLIPAKARLRDELPSHARVVTLENCGHLPMWDDPALITRTILEGAGKPAATASAPAEA